MEQQIINKIARQRGISPGAVFRGFFVDLHKKYDIISL